jgi:hypothetical protein
MYIAKKQMSQQRYQNNQSAGAYKSLPAAATAKAGAWRAEVLAVQQAQGVSYKEAMTIASEARKAKDGAYKTTKQRYVAGLDAVRKDGDYSPYGSKNKRPLSLSAAQRILEQYYRDNRENFSKGPLTAMRKDIGSCKKNPKKLLVPCPPDIKTRAQAVAAGHACANSWKYRPGKSAKGATGPAQYDMTGLDNLCGKDNAQARKDSKLYSGVKFMHKKNRVVGATVKNPETGRLVRVGGATHAALVKSGKLSA